MVYKSVLTLNCLPRRLVIFSIEIENTEGRAAAEWGELFRDISHP